ncbi:MAG: glycosyltransferase [Elioraea sp.]|nr:glycosyltransferase [Elioraea sp.]
MNATKRILQVAAIDFQVRHFLLPLMRALRDRGHRVEVAAADGPDLDPARAEGFPIHPVPFARSLDLAAHFRAYRRLRELLRRERFDIVHGHYPVAGHIARLAARAARVPEIVYTSHGYSFLKPGNPVVRALMFGAEALAARCQTTLFTQSSEEARIAERLRLAPSGGAIAIGNGVDPARFHPMRDAADRADRARLRAEASTPEDAVVLVIVSRLVAHKGHAELFAAAERLPAAHVWVVGERLASDHGTRLDAVIARARHTLGPRLVLLGRRSDVERVLRAADVFVLPSHFEGMPRTVAEAMMTGLPVVATAIRGTREQVVDGETGRLVPVGDVAALVAALAPLIADPSLRARYGLAARARAEALFDERAVIARQIAALGL